MQNISIHKASELPQAVKSAVEQLLGRPIEADEEVSVAAVPPQRMAPARMREEIVRSLEVLLNRRACKLKDIADEEIDTVIDETVDSVRHSRE